MPDNLIDNIYQVWMYKRIGPEDQCVTGFVHRGALYNLNIFPMLWPVETMVPFTWEEAVRLREAHKNKGYLIRIYCVVC